MVIFAKNDARKNTKISFRTDDETLAKLKSICRIENRTISSLIENILTDHVLVNEHPLLIEHEKRQSPRKKCSIPVVLLFETTDAKYYHNGMIVSMSSNFAQIVIKNLSKDHAHENKFKILFNIPKSDHPILIDCALERYKCSENECVIISKFTHINKYESELLQIFINIE
jgi:hypothetical protein